MDLDVYAWLVHWLFTLSKPSGGASQTLVPRQTVRSVGGADPEKTLADFTGSRRRFKVLRTPCIRVTTLPLF
jgi:hypothetical protein